MAGYKKMYIILCMAVDSVIDSLEMTSFASLQVQILKKALLDAEEIYLNTEES